MKRTPLKRKTPLRSRSRLKPQSAAKAAQMPSYHAAVAAARAAQVAARGHGYCSRCGRDCIPDPHHTQGRHGENLMVFVLICRRCHTWIHDNQKAARLEGILK